MPKKLVIHDLRESGILDKLFGEAVVHHPTRLHLGVIHATLASNLVNDDTRLP